MIDCKHLFLKKIVLYTQVKVSFMITYSTAICFLHKKLKRHIPRKVFCSLSYYEPVYLIGEQNIKTDIHFKQSLHLQRLKRMSFITVPDNWV